MGLLITVGGLAAALARNDSGGHAANASDAADHGPYRGSEPPPGIRLAPFVLRSYRGQRVSSSDLRGKVVALTFLESKCTEACPIIAVQVARGIDLLTPDEREWVRAIAISTQPSDDTDASVREFLARRHALGRLEYQIGTETAATADLAALSRSLCDRFGQPKHTHSASVHIYDRHGVWVSSLHPGVDLTPENFAADVRRALGS